VYQQVYPYKFDDFTLRVIILYSRLDAEPCVETSGALETLRSEFPYFTLDILYMPQFSSTPSGKRKAFEQKRAQEIFESLVKIGDEKSYIFAVENSEDLASRVLKFLGHPAFREEQKKEWFG